MVIIQKKKIYRVVADLVLIIPLLFACGVEF